MTGSGSIYTVTAPTGSNGELQAMSPHRRESVAVASSVIVAVELHKPVGVFSLEMRADELGLKLLSAESDIAARCSRAGQLSSQH